MVIIIYEKHGSIISAIAQAFLSPAHSNSSIPPFPYSWQNVSTQDETESRLYDDGFTGVFLNDDGNLNIGVVQNAVTK